MSYEHLSKIYYKDAKNHDAIYHARFNAPTTKYFNFAVKQFQRTKEFPAFLCYNEELFLLMERCYKRHENLLQTIGTVPELILRQFGLLCVVEEVKATNEVEGIHSSRREIKAVMNDNDTAARFSSIIKKYNALIFKQSFDFQTCEDVRNFYDEFAHEEIANENENHKLDGRIFRKGSVDIDSGTGKTLHRGIYPEEKIIAAMNTALNILNDAESPFLVRLAVFHYLFCYIHPFYDGNGRTVRFITAYHLATHFNSFAALSLSLIIKRNRKKYYDLFIETTAEINCGDLTPFVQDFIELLIKTFDEVSNTLNRKNAQLNKYQAKLLAIMPADELTGKIYQLTFQSSIFFGQGISMEELMKLTGKSRNTLKSRLKGAISTGDIIVNGDKKFFL